MCGKSDKRIRKTVFLMILLVFLSLFAVSCDYRIAFKEPDAIWNGGYVCDGLLQGSSILLLNSDRSFRYDYDPSATEESIIGFSEGEFRVTTESRSEELSSDGSTVVIYRGTITFISGNTSDSVQLAFSARLTSDDGIRYLIIGPPSTTRRPRFIRQADR